MWDYKQIHKNAKIDKVKNESKKTKHTQLADDQQKRVT